MIITIETIPHASQRYDTVGDWIWEDENYLRIRVSSMGRRRYAALVAVHELVEALLCWERGITTEMVDTFDKAFEAGRPEGNEDEPGDDPTCPYRESTSSRRRSSDCWQPSWEWTGPNMNAG